MYRFKSISSVLIVLGEGCAGDDARVRVRGLPQGLLACLLGLGSQLGAITGQLIGHGAELVGSRGELRVPHQVLEGGAEGGFVDSQGSLVR